MLPKVDAGSKNDGFLLANATVEWQLLSQMFSGNWGLTEKYWGKMIERASICKVNVISSTPSRIVG